MRGVRRRAFGEAGNLGSLALMDGANPLYTFDESAGVLINRALPGTFDQAVDAQVARGVVAPGGPDRKAYTFIQASQAGTPYGHAQGFRPDQNGWTRVTHEVVCRVPTLSQNGRFIFHGSWVGVAALFGMSNNASNQLDAYIALSGGYVQAFVNSETYKSGWHHYVFLYTGTNYQGYVDGVQDFDIVTGIGGPSFTDAAVNADRLIAFGGVQGFGGANADCDISHYAMYQNIALTPTQVLAHKIAAGV
jgi:hypothetical protein